MRVLIVLLILMIASLSFGQVTLFTGDNGDDSINVATGNTYISTVLFNAYPEGVATLWCAGDSTALNGSGTTGTYQVYYGLSTSGDSLFGVANAFSDSLLVKGDLTNRTYSSGSIVGRETDLGAIPWTLGVGVKFKITVNHTGWLVSRLLFF